ncbi:hypothetical protein PVA44_07695 (plasmid) [Entomospira nematocerorum]|uniref:Uncharacterized protein n=1 Tax=Entomospira nematocerorum TaxID=2719987 RepID=A0A968GDG8_9SPIO|nr:hypothetical protein [Entomospira nematocera]NIZ47795.1 hypothetical protein [Entomospira nematocera]WDI34773.1 hypothetical protein PVA44_07695 [Entomospira nematocera]
MKESQQAEKRRIAQELEFYRELRREYSTNPKRVQSGTNGANQHTVEYQSLAELDMIIERLEREYARFVRHSQNVCVPRSRGEIW